MAKTSKMYLKACQDQFEHYTLMPYKAICGTEWCLEEYNSMD